MNNLITGTFFLVATGTLARIIGSLYRIPLAQIISPEGMGLYGVSYHIYAFILMFSTAGIPTAVAKLTAENIALKNYSGVRRIFREAIKLLGIIGLGTSLLLAAGSGLVAKMAGNENASLTLLAIAPALLIVSLTTVFRGYFQGLQRPEPIGICQIAEPLGKLFLGLWLASKWVKMGDVYGATGAIIGFTISELLVLGLMVGFYFSQPMPVNREPVQFAPTSFEIIKKLARIAAPVTLSLLTLPLISVLDIVLILKLLQRINYTASEAVRLYGLFTQYVQPLISFPSIITMALGFCLVPVISEAFTRNQQLEIKRNITFSIWISIPAGLLATIGILLFAKPIIRLLYRNLTETDLLLTVDMLKVMAFGLVFLVLIYPLTAILQSLNRTWTPVRNLIIGALVKIGITYLLMVHYPLNIIGAAIGTVCCYGAAAILNLISVLKYFSKIVAKKQTRG